VEPAFALILRSVFILNLLLIHKIDKAMHSVPRLLHKSLQSMIIMFSKEVDDSSLVLPHTRQSNNQTGGISMLPSFDCTTKLMFFPCSFMQSPK
jgi:hypothetical protein